MRFSIRDLLLLAVIVGLAVSWAIDRTRLERAARKDREVIARLEAAGVDPSELLDHIASAPPLVQVVTINRGATGNGFGPSSDYQAPPSGRKSLESHNILSE